MSDAVAAQRTLSASAQRAGQGRGVVQLDRRLVCGGTLRAQQGWQEGMHACKQLWQHAACSTAACVAAGGRQGLAAAGGGRGAASPAALTFAGRQAAHCCCSGLWAGQSGPA